MWGHGSDWGMMGGWGWIGPFNMLFWLILVIVVIAVIVWFVQSPRRSGRLPLPSTLSPGLATLDERYARGEINRDEYLQKRNDILASR
jgi:putative membrane protein